MDDRKIIDGLFARDEAAINQIREKYGAYCRAIAMRVLGNVEDAAECENDTYFAAWRSIPPAKPENLSVYLAAITRRTAISRYRKRGAIKRDGEAELSLCELEDCISDGKSVDESVDVAFLAGVISDFLFSLPQEESNIFLRRYWYFDSVKELSDRFCISQSKVKTTLCRTRKKLLQRLEKEDIFV